MISFIFLYASCSHESLKPVIPIAISPQNNLETDLPSNLVLERVKNLYQQPQNMSLIEDVYYLALAKDLHNQGRFKEAIQAWYDALSIVDDSFGKIALEGWVRSFINDMSQNTHYEMLAKIFQIEFKTRKAGPYISKLLEKDQFKLKKALAKILNQSFKSSTESEMEALPPTERGIPANDPLLTETKTKFCQNASNDSYQWQAWINTLSVDHQEYWQALVTNCDGKNTLQEIALWRHAITILNKNPQNIAFLISSTRSLISLLRLNDQRPLAADYYADLVGYWQSPLITHQAFGWTEEKLLLSRIDDVLWAARYQALIANYRTAKAFAIMASELVAQAYSVLPTLSTQARLNLVNFQAEAWHIRAFRIAIEEQDYAHASYLTSLALQIEQLPKEWKNQFLWYQGFYLYLAGNLHAAMKSWTNLIGQDPDESLLIKTHFWMARLYHQLGQRKESLNHLAQVNALSPLSFYAVIAPAFAKLPNASLWQRNFSSPKALSDQFKSKSSYRISSLYDNDTLYRQLKKTELLIANQISEYANPSAQRLQALIRKTLTVNRNTESFLYLSRLLYASGNYLESISLTTELANAFPEFWKNWPEQLFIYFPRPFYDIYTRRSFDESLDINQLLGVSRQESSFNKKATSEAGALGIMQLIIPTASKFSSDPSLTQQQIYEKLLEPAFNIHLGSKYLKFLSMKYQANEPAIYAAYNAGEFAVDHWLKHRHHADVLTWVELIPFGETRSYCQNVWRNKIIYQYLQQSSLQTTAFN